MDSTDVIVHMVRHTEGACGVREKNRGVFPCSWGVYMMKTRVFGVRLEN